MWSPVKGAELYETTAAQTNDVIHCNDTAPVCALSDLRCNTAYSVTVTPCSDLRGCNRTCTPQTHETGTDGVVLKDKRLMKVETLIKYIKKEISLRNCRRMNIKQVRHVGETQVFAFLLQKILSK